LDVVAGRFWPSCGPFWTRTMGRFGSWAVLVISRRPRQDAEIRCVEGRTDLHLHLTNEVLTKSNDVSLADIEGSINTNNFWRQKSRLTFKKQQQHTSFKQFKFSEWNHWRIPRQSRQSIDNFIFPYGKRSKTLPKYSIFTITKLALAASSRHLNKPAK